jgi:DNA invertase Pin-like site-specific DNA recombinase
MARQVLPEQWTRESEAAALARLRSGTTGPGSKPIVLVYTRQSVSDFDEKGLPVGPSLDQQLHSVLRLGELQGLAFEHFQDADRSGKETSKRRGYLAMMERIRSAAPDTIGAVGTYDQDRLHRNDLEFYAFMAEMAARRILVFDASSGLISHAQKLPWKIKAIMAQDEREHISRRARDNARHLKRQGRLLGVIPQGYRQTPKGIVKDPKTGPVVREIFTLYATGKYSLRSLARELNARGVRPARNPSRGHNRPPALIFTDGVLKDLLQNVSYTGKVRVDGELVPGLHPALVDQATFDRCQAVRALNTRRVSKTWTRFSYPLTPLLRCGKCGGQMHGHTSSSRSKINPLNSYYVCWTRRRWSARDPEAIKCDARWIRARELEGALRDDLRRCLPTAELNEAYRQRLRDAVKKARAPQLVTKTAIDRLEQQLGRAKWMLEAGIYTPEEYMGRQVELRTEQHRLRQLAAERPKVDTDPGWCEAAIVNLLDAWNHADSAQRARLMAGIYERVEVEAPASGEGPVEVIAVPRPDWAPFFRDLANRVSLERETRVSRAVSAPPPPIRFSYRLADVA